MLVKRKFVTELLTNQTTVHYKSNNSKESKKYCTQVSTIWRHLVCCRRREHHYRKTIFQLNFAKFSNVVSILNDEQGAKVTTGYAHGD